MNYKFISINGSGFNLDSFGDFRHQFQNATTVPYSKSFLSLVSGKAQITLSAFVDFETYYCLDYTQCSIITSTGGFITSDTDYIYLDGVNVPFVFDSGFFVFQAGRYVWIVKDSLIDFPSSAPAVVAPFNLPMRSHYIFEIDLSVPLTALSDQKYYKDGSLVFGGYSLVNSTECSVSVKGSIPTGSSDPYGFFDSLENNYYFLPEPFFVLSNGCSFEISFTGVDPYLAPTLFPLYPKKYIRVFNTFFQNYVDAVLYANNNGANIDISQLFYKDPSVIDTTTAGYEFQIGILQDEITNQIGLKQLAQSSLSVAQTQLSEATTNLTICQSSKTTLEATIVSNADKLATAIDLASTATGLAKVNETISSGLTTYYQSEIDRLTLALTEVKTLSDSKIATLETENQTLSTLSKTKFDALVIPATLTSLNGLGSEFIDGTLVKVDARPYTYVVIRSFNALVADNNYTVIYDLLSDDRHSLSVPEALVTAVIPTVTAP